MKTHLNELIEENGLLLVEKEDAVRLNRQLETRNEGLIL
jgi:hypothetical protein